MPELNRGTVLLRAAREPGVPRTVLVIGYKRSGTSVIARLLQLLGVRMGDTADAVVVEDQRLAEALRPRLLWGASARALDALIAEYDRRVPCWGFKKPARNRAVLRNLRRFRNPHIVYVVRDPAAIAARVTATGNTSFTRAFVRAGLQQLWLFRGVRASNAPALVLSYEKLLGNSHAVIAELAAFCGLAADDALLARCVQAVSPNRNAYTQAWNKPPPGMGYVDHVSRTHIAGWATLDYDTEPVEVQLLAGEHCIAAVLADLPRPDVRERRMHRDGDCGFSFDLAALAALLPADTTRLSVRIAATGFELANSPVSLPRWLRAQ